MTTRNRHNAALPAAAFLASLLAAGCKPPPEAAAPPPPEVAVVMVQPQQVLVSTDLPGRTAAYLVSEIRPQVSGLIQKRLYTEGSDVAAGQVLYEIDPAPFQAAYDSAAASVAAAREAAARTRATLAVSVATVKRHQATLSLAQTNLRRVDSLVQSRAVSVMERDQAVTDVEVAEATVRAAEAQVECDRQAVAAAEAAIKQAEAAQETARISLGYTKITAPIAGRIGRSSVTEGAIVTAYQPVPLATIQQFDPIYVDVPQSTVELNRLRRGLANGRLKENEADSVRIRLEDGTAYPQPGALKFRDVTVDPTTGSVILRIVVPNPDGTLLPGMFVRATIDEGLQEGVLLLPQQAVGRDPKGKPFALLVNAENKIEQRQLTTDRAVGDQWLISAGLAAGERVVVEGLQKARPGTLVTVVPFEAGTPGGPNAGPEHAAPPPKPE